VDVTIYNNAEHAERLDGLNKHRQEEKDIGQQKRECECAANPKTDQHRQKCQARRR